MGNNQIFNQVEEIIRRSEVMAVVRAVCSGQPPRLGASVDYFIEAPGANSRGPKVKPYRVEIEQWHLDAAQQVLAGRAASRPF